MMNVYSWAMMQSKGPGNKQKCEHHDVFKERWLNSSKSKELSTEPKCPGEWVQEIAI